MPECKHAVELEDVEYDLDELLAGIAEGNIVWMSGICPQCKQFVTREYSCTTSIDKDQGFKGVKK